MIKSWKNYTAEKTFDKNCNLLKDAQATGKVFSPQKRTSSKTKRDISLLFSGSFLPC
jgi:hypothetical protein